MWDAANVEFARGSRSILMRLCQTSSLPYRCQPLDNLILYPPPPSICSTMPRNKSRFFRWRPIFSFARQLHFPPIVHIAGFVGRRGEKGEVTRLSLSHHQRSGKKWIIPLFLFLRIPLSFHTRTTVSVIIRDTVLGKWKLWRIWSKEKRKRLKKEQAASVGLWGFCQVT